MKFILSLFLIVAVAVLGIPSQGLTDIVTYRADLSGPAEDPPNTSPGTGLALVTYDDVAHLIRIQASVSNLLAPTILAHIHAPTAIPFAGNVGVATQLPFFDGFPIGVTSGNYDHTFDLTLLPGNSGFFWNPSFFLARGADPAAVEEAFIGFINEGRAYFNIHSSMFPAGEIRGFIVPAPATVLLFSTGLAGLAALRFRRKKF